MSIINESLNFYQIGLNYQKADAEIRGRFSLDENSKINIINQAKEEGLTGILVISTCNRTELYAFAKHPYQLIKLLCDNTNGTVAEFEKVSSVNKNNNAIANLFNVGSGLQSQILGDFEIISQIKQSASVSKEHNMLCPFIERLVNSVIQASKRIKTETKLSSGATSVSFASVQYILRNVEDIKDKNILLFGTGKIGRNTCENLVKHSKNDHIVLINRTKEKAEKVAGKFNLIVKDYENIEDEIKNTDILIVATGASRPTVTASMIPEDKSLLILDLSIPKNVENAVNELPNAEVLHLDYLSQLTDETIENRKLEIPKAKEILQEVLNDFNTWVNTRKFAPTIHALKQKLDTLKVGEIDTARKKFNGSFSEQQAEMIGNQIVQKITNHLAHELRKEMGDSTESIDFIQKMFQLQVKEA